MDQPSPAVPGPNNNRNCRETIADYRPLPGDSPEMPGGSPESPGVAAQLRLLLLPVLDDREEWP